MNERFLIAVLILAGTANLCGHNSKVLTEIQNRYSEISAHNQKQEQTFFDKYQNLVQKEETFKDAFDDMIEGIRIQMGENGEKEGNFSLGTNCVDRMIIGSEIVKIGVFAKTIDLHQKMVYEKTKSNLLHLKIKIADYCEEMFSIATKSKTSSIEAFYENSSDKHCFRKIFSNEIRDLKNRYIKNLYQKIIIGIHTFKQQRAFQNPSTIEDILQIEDKIFSCLCEILHLTNPKNYIQKIKKKVSKALSDIDKEIKEEFEILEQKEIENELEKDSMPSDEEIAKEWQLLEEEQLKEYFMSLDEQKKLAERKKGELLQAIQTEYHMARELLGKLEEIDTKTLMQTIKWSTELQQIAEKTNGNMSIDQLANSFARMQQIHGAAQCLDFKLQIKKHPQKTNDPEIDELRQEIWNIIHKANQLIRINSSFLKNNYDRQIGQVRKDLRRKLTVQQLKILLEIAKIHLKEIEEEVALFKRLKNLKS